MNFHENACKTLIIIYQINQNKSIVYEDKDKIIEVQGALIGNLQKQIKEMEKTKAESAKRHAKKRKSK